MKKAPVEATGAFVCRFVKSKHLTYYILYLPSILR